MISCSKSSGDSPEFALPEATLLITPTNEDECYVSDSSGNFGTVEFVWTPVPSALNYTLHVSNKRGGEPISITGLTQSTQEIVLALGYTYEWYVETFEDGNPASSKSTIWSFYSTLPAIVNSIPHRSEAVFPLQNDVVEMESGQITLKWNASDVDADRLSHVVHIDSLKVERKDFTMQSDELEQKEYTTQFKPNTTYYWYIVTSDAYSSSYSPIYSFNTK